MGGDGGYVKVDGGWKRRSAADLCLGTRVLEGESFEERQRQNVLGYARDSIELYRGDRIPGFDAICEKERRQFKLTRDGGSKATSMEDYWAE